MLRSLTLSGLVLLYQVLFDLLLAHVLIGCCLETFKEGALNKTRRFSIEAWTCLCTRICVPIFN